MTSLQVIFVLVLMLVGALMHPLAERLRLPYSLLLMLIGYVASGLVTSWGFDTGIRWHYIHFLVLDLILPILIFHTAIQIRTDSIRRCTGPIFLLVFPLMLLGIAVTATILYYGIGHATGFPWIIAWLAAALLSATDPSPVVAILRKVGAEDLATIIETEGLLNDVTAILLFGILVSAVMSGDSIYMAWTEALIRSGYVFIGGIGIGIITGLIASMLLRLVRHHHVVIIATLVIVYLTYLLADDVWHVSGLMAIFSCGLVIGRYQKALPTENLVRVHDFWRLAGLLSVTGLFLLGGITVTLDMFADQWLAMLIAISAVLLARSLMMLLLWLIGLRWPSSGLQQGHDHFLLGWSGVRGAVTLALALSLPLEITGWYTVQSMAYGVVIFGLVVQASTFYPLLKYYSSKS